MASSKGISVVICSFNSATRLPPTLAHLAAQRVPATTSWEVIVVDNASRDETAATAAAEWQRHGCAVPFRVVAEPSPGLSAARRKGLFDATYDYVLLCDDDNWLAPDYVARAFDLMEADSSIGVLGGQSGPATQDVELPAWFYTYAGEYAIGAQAIASGDVSEKGYVWGAGMVIRAPLIRALYRCGHEPILADRSGGKLSSGGDSEICKWYLMAGYRLWFDENLSFRHFVPAVRLTKEYLLGIRRGFAEAYPLLCAYDAYMARPTSRLSTLRNLIDMLRAYRTFYKVERVHREAIRRLAATISTSPERYIAP